MGKIDALGITGMALGIIEELKIEERTIRLDRGHTLLFYTDGLTEAFSPQDEMYGEARLKELIRRESQSSAQELLATIQKSVDDFIHPLPIADDVTMLAVRRIP